MPKEPSEDTKRLESGARTSSEVLLLARCVHIIMSHVRTIPEDERRELEVALVDIMRRSRRYAKDATKLDT